MTPLKRLYIIKREYKESDVFSLKPPLTKEERESLMHFATKEQLDFLLYNVRWGHRTKFLNMMADKKVTLVRSQDITLEEIEQDAAGWILDEYIDYGKGNYLGKCACNRKLRRVFIVKHEETGKTIHYGENHFLEFLGIDKNVLKDLVTHFTMIDLEFDELLIKIKEGQYGYDVIEEDFHGMDLPEDIKSHMNANVPLLDRQIERLYRELRIIEREMRLRKQKEMLEQHQHMMEQIQKEKIKIEETVNRVHESLPPKGAYDDIAYQLVQNGISSTVEICEILIDYFGADATLSLGVHQRPRILPSILYSLLQQVEQGNLILVEKIGMEDCLFKINDHHLDIELEMDVDIEAEKDAEKEEHPPEQLTFF